MLFHIYLLVSSLALAILWVSPFFADHVQQKRVFRNPGQATDWYVFTFAFVVLWPALTMIAITAIILLILVLLAGYLLQNAFTYDEI